MKLLENKTALITGASRGIGRHTALMLAQHGANVIFTDLKEDENSQSLLKELTDMGVRASFFAGNAANFEEVEALVKNIMVEYDRIDILVNNAGITRDKLLLKMTPEDWDLVLNVNLRSCFCLTKVVMPIMMKQRYGSIINISSIVGLIGNAGQCNYSASKAGIVGFTKSVAKELGSRNIRCNAVAPGYIETPMTATLPENIVEDWKKQIPLRRMGQPDDVAKTVVYLASDLSDYITGQVLECTGGLGM
ncbi:MAG: 3-oxoacyl-[acyl-carrier-protein] reductase [Bacteroidales bacterium]|nr:3-oxoacyl-[acyl-carrier-protein] reductase [Bacteroidales bacterium]